MDDPIAAVRGLQAEPPSAIRPPVEGDAEPCKMLDGSRCRLDDPACDGLVAQACAGGDSVRQMQGRVVIPAHRSRQAALRPEAGGFRPKRGFRQQYDRLRSQLQGRHQTGGTAADDHRPTGQR